MDQSSEGGSIKGVITAPTSKSYAQRAIAASLLCEGCSTLTNMALCNDTEAALEVACNLGATISNNGSTYTINGGIKSSTDQLNIGESGLATRLFTPIASLLSTPITITGRGSIMKRPFDMIEKPLRELGVKESTHKGYLPITVCGPLKGGHVEVDGSLSSQFLTGLLMASPLAENDTTISVNKLASKPYIDMTIALAEAFGVEIEHDDYRQFYIRGGQKYEPITYNIEGDWSGASTLLVAGATSGEVTINNLNPISLQADTAIIHALELAGAEIITTPNSVTVRHAGLKSFEFDATHCPDLFPALVALAASCKGETILIGTNRLTHKESDRAKTIAEVFSKIGIHIDRETENIMKITGSQIHGAVVSSHNDHRIAMAAAVTGLRSSSPITITDAQAVDKSYPEFWHDLNSLRVKA